MSARKRLRGIAPRAWVLWAFWWLFFVAVLATNVTLDVWLFVKHQWILSAVLTAITVVWAKKVFVDSGFVRYFAKRVVNRSR